MQATEAGLTVRKPRSVVVSAILLYVILTLQIIVAVIETIDEWHQIPSPVVPFFGKLLCAGLVAWLIQKMSQGVNWARTILLLRYLLFSFISISTLVELSRLIGSINLRGYLLEVFELALSMSPIIALLFTFRRGSNTWFHPGRNAPQSLAGDSGPTVPFQLRALTVVTIALITFMAGAFIYFNSVGSGQGSNDYFLAAVLMFPAGFSALLPPNLAQGQGHTSLCFGWGFYAIILTFLLIQKQAKPFTVACIVLVVAILLNLQGCSHLLKQ